MNWAVLLVALLIAGLIAAAVNARLKSKRPGWASWRRVVAAGAVPAAGILALSLIGIAWAYATAPARGEGNREMVSFIIGLVGAIFALAALAGGLIGAAIAERKQ